jgi:hypothetical protein
MNLKQYNALTGDTKLAAALAIAMGWQVELRGVFDCVIVSDTNPDACGFAYKAFDPFSDDSIPYGLIGLRGIGLISDIAAPEIEGTGDDAKWCALSEVYGHGRTKTHAIVNAYINTDPMGHLAKFLKGE